MLDLGFSGPDATARCNPSAKAPAMIAVVFVVAARGMCN
ncbi:hypothetical protein BVG79_00194 [Ketogulonicigenium robustum]|uniref:Uncharacterized protein n=1 Tax=Ketogulonicigenium robustum TaxID=92947 RepID=A0A1W6NWH8_9RHOB|nr:hypothetical protein BVG79_00194 [Ketogulonicigenium robustum]